MISFVTIAQYIEAVESLEHRLREPYNFKAVYDDSNTPRYKVRGGTLFFDVIDAKTKEPLSLILFLNRKAQEQFAQKHSTCEVIVSGLFASVDNTNGVWVDMALMQRNETMQTNKETVTQNRLLTEGRRAFVDVAGKWGYLNESEEIVIEPQWSNVSDFYEGRAVVQVDNYYGVIDEVGQTIVPTEYDDLSWDGSQYVYGEKEFYWGVIDRMGAEVVAFEWDWIGEFSQGLLLVQRDGKFGYLNSKGELALDIQYDDATSFSEFGFASVTIGEDEFHISPDGKRV